MYIQSMENIKAIIIPIDSVVFHLNQYRYNYYKELCDQHNINITKEEFYNHLGSMQDMYKDMNLVGFNDCNELNDYIENKLYDYLKYNYLKMTDGLLEIVHYANQKDIKIAMISTHKTSHAVAYLKAASLYDKVQYIVGSDSHLAPLPDCAIINAIMSYFEVSPADTLVISSFDALTKASNDANVNVICVDEDIDYKPNGSYYKKADDLYAVLNMIMFEKYEQYTMFSNLLGMNSKMSKEELIHRKEVLKEDFKNDNDVLRVIDHTYNYHIAMLQDVTPLNNEEEVLHKTIIDDIVEEDIKQEVNTNNPVYTLNENEGEELSRLIHEIAPEDNKEEPTEVKEEIVEEKKKKRRFLNFILGLGDCLMLSLWVLVVGILIYILFGHEIRTVKELVFIGQWFNTYYSYICLCIEYILDSLHSLIPSIYSYEQYMNSPALSDVVIMLINTFAGNTVVICILKVIKDMIFKKK